MVAEFHIEVDAESGTFEPVDLHIRMEHHRSDGTEVAVEMELVSVAMDREGLVELTPKENESPEPILVYEVRLTDRLLSSENFESEIVDPVQVTFTARPKPETPDATPPEPLEQRCDIVIESPGDIHWTVADDPTTRDAPIELDADGSAEFTLSVTYEAWDPKQRKVHYDPEAVDFTHWTGPGFDPDIFGPAEGDEPWVVGGEANNRDHSRWASKTELPDPARPNVTIPLESHIRVRVWPRGTIIRQRGKIGFKEGAKLLGEREVPVTLLPAKQVVELVDPTEPVPADGQEHPLVLRLLRERDKQPVKKGTYTFEFEPGEHHRGGKLTEAEAELTEDMNGEVELTYVAPELTYEPGKSFTERLQVFRGSGEHRQLIDTIPVHLSPEVELRIEPEKEGLEWDPFELTIPAGEAPDTIRGTLVFDVTDPVKGNEVALRVAHAEVWVHTGPGAGTKVTPALTSDKQGQFVWKLPELAKGLEKLPKERREKVLDPDSERPECSFEQDAEAVIRFYEQKVHQYAPWELFEPGVQDQIKRHRVVFGEQLAQNPEEWLERAVSGTEMLRTAVCFGHTYDDIYDSQMGVVSNGLKGIFMEVVGLAINAADLGTKIGRVAGNLAAWVDDVAGNVARRVGGYVTTEFASGLRYAARTIIDFLDNFLDETVTPHVRDMIEGVIGAWRTIADTASDLIHKSGSRLEDLVTGAINLLCNALKALGNLVVAGIMMVLTAGAALISLIMDAIGSLLSRCAGEPLERFIRAVGHLMTGTTPRGAEVGKWTIGKAFEELYKAVLDQLAAAQRAAGGVTSSVSGALDLMGWAAHYSVDWLDGEVTELRVPDDPDPRIDDFRDTTLAMGVQQAQLGAAFSLLEQALAILDAVVLVIELVLMLLAMFTTCGALNPVTLGPALTAFEISFAKVKLFFVRFPALAFNLGGAVGIAGSYGLQVWSLPGDVAAPTLPAGASA